MDMPRPYIMNPNAAGDRCKSLVRAISGQMGTLNNSVETRLNDWFPAVKKSVVGG